MASDDSSSPKTREPGAFSSRVGYRRFRETVKGLFRLAGTISEEETLGKAAVKDADEEEGPAPSPKWRETVGDYLRMIARFRGGIIGVFVLASISAALEMLLPLGTGLVVDRVLQNSALDADGKMYWLVVGSSILLTMALVSRIFDSWREYRLQTLNTRIVSRIRSRLFDKFLHLPLGRLHDMKTGGVASRLTSDVDSVSGLAQIALISPGLALLRLVLALVVVLLWNWKLSLVLAALLAPLTFLSLIWIGKIRPVWDAFYHLKANIDARLYETFNGIRVVRSFNRELRELRRFLSGHHTVLRAHLHGVLLSQVTGVVWSFLIPATGVAVLWYGGWLYLQGEAELGQILGFYGYCAALIYPVYALVGTANDLQKAGAALERILSVMREEPENQDPAQPMAIPEKVTELRLEEISFGYRDDRVIIPDFNLTIPGGGTVALAGPSGCGKSTLTDLVARFYHPQQGRILLNGIDARQFRLSDWRKMFGIVSQDVFLFDGTIAENIAYGAPEATAAQIERAARLANAHEFIEQQPRGYRSRVGERGTRLSGGQRQRLSIARALLADPPILILDEATSNLDTESEHLIQQALETLRHGRTTLVIAHRLSTIATADVIVVMDKGRIVEQGSHETLMRQQGRYWHMVEQQRSHFTESDADVAKDVPSSNL